MFLLTRLDPRSTNIASAPANFLLPKVNPEIVGGLVVEIGDRTIDLSVAARIAKMNKLLTDSL
jgi:F-type H+-transporting ATPase subunit O